MNARRFRKDSAQRLAEFRWWGCVLLAMFALVQAARGSVGSITPSEPVRSDSTHPLASAVCEPKTHAVVINVATAAPASDEAELPLISNPLEAPRDQFGGARPNAIRIASAALNDVNAGDLPIQTP